MEYKFSKTQIEAFENDKLVGNVILGRQSENVYRVLRVYVDPLFRGRGIASQLVDQTILYARQNKLKLVAVCSYAVMHFERKKDEYSDVIFK